MQTLYFLIMTHQGFGYFTPKLISRDILTRFAFCNVAQITLNGGFPISSLFGCQFIFNRFKINLFFCISGCVHHFMFFGLPSKSSIFPVRYPKWCAHVFFKFLRRKNVAGFCLEVTPKVFCPTFWGHFTFPAASLNFTLLTLNSNHPSISWLLLPSTLMILCM